MTAAAIITAILCGASFLAAIASGFIWFGMTSQGAPGSVTRIWFALMVGLVGAGWLFGWAAWS